MRVPVALTGRAPQCPSDDAATGAKAMTQDEVRQSIAAFIDAARRCARAGFMSYFTDLDRGSVQLGAAGKIMGGSEAASVLAAGMDFVVLGRAAILHHDFPRRMAENPAFHSIATPVTPSYLLSEGLSDSFVKYVRNWKGFVTEPEELGAE